MSYAPTGACCAACAARGGSCALGIIPGGVHSLTPKADIKAAELSYRPSPVDPTMNRHTGKLPLYLGIAAGGVLLVVLLRKKKR